MLKARNLSSTSPHTGEREEISVMGIEKLIKVRERSFPVPSPVHYQRSLKVERQFYAGRNSDIGSNLPMKPLNRSLKHQRVIYRGFLVVTVLCGMPFGLE